MSVNVFQGNAVDGREHDGHEQTDEYQAVEAYHAFNTNGTDCTNGSAYAEQGEQTAGIHKLHDVGADETTGKVE